MRDEPNPAAPELGGLITWRQHDRISVEGVHGATADSALQQAMSRAALEVLTARGFAVNPLQRVPPRWCASSTAGDVGVPTR